MAKQVELVKEKKESVTPWWERSKTYGKMWRGSLFDRMVLKGTDEEEQRIQTLRDNLLIRPEGKRGYLSIERAKLLTDSYRQTEGEAAILRKAKGFKHVCQHISIPYQEGQLLMGDPTAMVPGTEVEPEFFSNWMERDVYCEEVGATISEIDALKVRGVDAWVVNDEDIKTLKEYILLRERRSSRRWPVFAARYPSTRLNPGGKQYSAGISCTCQSISATAVSLILPVVSTSTCTPILRKTLKTGPPPRSGLRSYLSVSSSKSGRGYTCLSTAGLRESSPCAPMIR